MCQNGALGEQSRASGSVSFKEPVSMDIWKRLARFVLRPASVLLEFAAILPALAGCDDAVLPRWPNRPFRRSLRPK